MASTGPAQLPDVGTLSYNGVTFSSLFATKVTCNYIPDAANRTTKWVEYTINASGYVTLGNDPTLTIDSTMYQLRQLLSAAGGALTYKGKGLGNDLTVNTGTGPRDCAWGPIPKVLDFQPLGASRSALIDWSVVTRIPEIAKAGFGVLQFNEESSLTYDEDGYAAFTIKGTLEIPLTRPTQTERDSHATADDLRVRFMQQVALNVDLQYFRPVRRNFNISRDKRTMEWEMSWEEIETMGQPIGCFGARGSFTCRPDKPGAGLASWICTLRATYPVRKDWPRRMALWAFLSLLRFRIAHSTLGNLAPIADNGNAAQNPQVQAAAATLAGVVFPFAGNRIANWMRGQMAQAQAAAVQFEQRPRHIIINFEFDEGIYKNSRTTTFSASYRLMTTVSHILWASGLWKQEGTTDRRNWSIAMADISGGESWLRNQIDPAGDVIVDFGGGA